MFWLLALLQGLPLFRFFLPFFRACFVYVLAFFFQPPEPKSAPLGHPGDPPHSLLGSLSPHCWALLCPWAWNPLSQQVRFLYPWVRFLYPWTWNPLQVRCWQSWRRSKMKRNSALHLLQCLSPGQGHSLSQGHLLTLKQAHLLGLLPA